MNRIFKFVAVTAVLALVAPSLAGWQANLGPSHSSFPSLGGGSWGVDLKVVGGGPAGGIPAGLYFGPSLGESWNSGANHDTYGRTFCVESVSFSPGSWYWASIDSNIISGGPGQNVNLTTDTREVFAHYVLNTSQFQTAMAGMGLGTIGGDWNKVMQAFFWDQQLVSSDGTTFYNALNAAQKTAYNNIAGLTSAGLGDVSIGSVKVLNLWGNWSQAQGFYGDKQSHLVLVIPAPEASLLGVLGLGIAVALKRRFA